LGVEKKERKGADGAFFVVYSPHPHKIRITKELPTILADLQLSAIGYLDL